VDALGQLLRRTLVLAALLAAPVTPAAAMTWSAPQLVDGAGPFPQAGEVAALSCPTASLCVAVDHHGEAISTTRPTAPAAEWTTAQIDAGHSLTAVSCPAGTSLCVAVDAAGRELTSDNPATGAWTTARTIDLGHTLQDLSCPSSDFCAAVDDEGRVLTTSEPVNGPWHSVALTGAALTAVSCPSSTACFALDEENELLALTDLTANVASWTTTTLPEVHPQTISCPSTSLCVTGDATGALLASTEPAGTHRSSWKPVGRNPLAHAGAGILGVSCPSASLCVAIDEGTIESTTTPTGPASAWTTARVSSSQLTAVSCASASECVAVTSDAHTVSSAATATQSWASELAPHLKGVSCDAANLCAAYDDSGDIAVSAAAKAPWTLAHMDGAHAIDGVACPTAAFCVAVDDAGGILTSREPANAAAWTRRDIDGDKPIYSVACPSTGLCVAGGKAGRVFSSRAPAAGRWRSAFIDPHNFDVAAPTQLSHLSCVSVRFCLFIDDWGDTLTSTHPAGGRKAWKKHGGEFPPAGETETLDCVSAHFCFAPSYGGEAVWTFKPSGSAEKWHSRRVTPGTLSGSCSSPRRCLIVTENGLLLQSSDLKTWQRTRIDGFRPLSGIDCHLASRCVAVDAVGDVLEAG
jgi:hypothetical protein